jgi:hypothetical protein
MPCDLGFPHTDDDRLCPPGTTDSRCDADPARTEHRAGVLASGGYVSPGTTTSQNNSKSLSRSGCGPEIDSMDEEISTSSSVLVGVPL